MLNQFDSKVSILLITDLDGTLIDSRQAIADAINATLLHLRMEPIEDQELFRLVGISIVQIFEAQLRGPQIQEAVAFYRSQLIQNGASKTRVMPGAIDALKTFRRHQIKTFVASNKISSLAQTVVAQQGLDGLLDGVVGSDLAPPKPDPGIIRHIMDKNPAKRTIMFGDRPEDVVAGRRAGAETVFLRGEFSELLERSQIVADLQVSNWTALKEYLVASAPPLP